MPFFQKLENNAAIFGKNALIVVIYGLNLSFKMQFLSVSRKKNKTFLSTSFFTRSVNGCLSKCPGSKKTLLP